MSENSKIEWTDSTFNPWEGCQKIGPGCDHCYAETRNARFGGGTAANWGPGAPRRRTSAANWLKPLAWEAAHAEFFATHGRRQRVFCASLADVFDNAVDPPWRVDLFRLIAKTPNLDWLLLTKRIGNARDMLNEVVDELSCGLNTWDELPWPGVWIGATVVNQEEADRDVPKLLAVPARVRFLSIEPMLGPIDLLWPETLWPDGPARCCSGHECGCGGQPIDPWLIYGVNWVIVGGESSPGARPMHPDWPRDLRDQCAVAGVPFLFKQWGEWSLGSGDFGAGRFKTAAVARDGHVAAGGLRVADYPAGAASADGWTMVHRAGKRAAGRLLDGRTHDEFPKDQG
ncbi:phage Gp37/Gp68 family protein [Burkholderia pyrrocinia]|uniref:phage Gp37/Gp68 family protein n=1 Tax=Burkholderia pyrrocinia TaxID=60550 RepID=UPI00158AFA21|nr:phage Gp37/Gp68 family protein [Burkholderia pyrrocinia]